MAAAAVIAGSVAAVVAAAAAASVALSLVVHPAPIPLHVLLISLIKFYLCHFA